MDELIKTALTVVALVAFSAISAWLKRRQGEEAESENRDFPPVNIPPLRKSPPAGRPGQPSAPPPPKRPDWEEELRRLLEGNTEDSTPAQPPQPPPVPPVTQSPLASKPAPAWKKDDDYESLPVPLPLPKVLASVKLEQTDAQTVPLDIKLSEASQAYERALNLSQRVEKHMHPSARIPAVAQQKVLHRRRQSPEVVQVLHSLGNPQGARQALVASLIFGPPKAMEMDP